MQISKQKSEPFLRALIVDDEPLARKLLRSCLLEVGGVEVVAECADGEAAVEAIRALAPDVVFLDIQMPRKTGFDVIEAIGPHRMPKVVFATAYDDRAIEAFDVQALDYLLKPITVERLRRTMERVRESLEDGGADPQSEPDVVGGSPILLGSAGSAPEFLSRIMVREGDRAIPLRVADIDWIEGASNYVVLHANSKQHRLRTTIKALLERLDTRQFVRIHKSSIVNLDRVKELQPWFGGDYVAILHDGKQLRVSRRFAPDVLRPLR